MNTVKKTKKTVKKMREGRLPSRLYMDKICGFCGAIITPETKIVHDDERGVDYCSKRCHELFEEMPGIIGHQ